MMKATRARPRCAPAGPRRTRTTRRAWSGSSGASSILRRAAPSSPTCCAFQPRIALIGAVNGLAQTLLKLTAPGVPDTYQGCELWDLSLVDPDNRRPVDFELRRTYPASRAPIRARCSPAGRTAASSSTSSPARSRCGARSRSCSRPGSYEPLEAAGALADRVVAFARRSGAGNDGRGRAAPGRRPAPGSRSCPALPGPRGTTRASSCPPAFAGRDAGEPPDRAAGAASSGALEVGDALAELPVALLVAPDLPQLLAGKFRRGVVRYHV